jgi:hypothetical protein
MTRKRWAALFTADAVETGPEEAISGQQDIEDRYCAIAEWSMMQKIHASQPMLLKEGYVVTINVREGDTWKIRMLYWSYK